MITRVAERRTRDRAACRKIQTREPFSLPGKQVRQTDIRAEGVVGFNKGLTPKNYQTTGSISRKLQLEG